ncbi:hypothetical protein NH340_JMT01849 [Sarcoptes scabiei]|nr:hypothetical protein NH340_JMT01849 [Sarcoptes scabiei]
MESDMYPKTPELLWSTASNNDINVRAKSSSSNLIRWMSVMSDSTTRTLHNGSAEAIITDP